MIDWPLTLEDFDRESMRLEWALRLQGGSTLEIRELISARENARQRRVELEERQL
jgi:hypothetical protein